MIAEEFNVESTTVGHIRKELCDEIPKPEKKCRSRELTMRDELWTVRQITIGKLENGTTHCKQLKEHEIVSINPQKYPPNPKTGWLKSPCEAKEVKIYQLSHKFHGTNLH